jgi:hypothetical protein
VGEGYQGQAHITIGPEGDLYVSSFDGADFGVQQSTDDGRTFTIPNHDTGQGIAFGTGFATFVNDNGPPMNRFRTNQVRAIAADPTRPGTIYAVEVDQVLDALGNVIDYADVVFARSSDYGQTWKTSFMVGPYTATALNDDNHGQPATGSPDDVITSQALPRLAVDAPGEHCRHLVRHPPRSGQSPARRLRHREHRRRPHLQPQLPDYQPVVRRQCGQVH